MKKAFVITNDYGQGAVAVRIYAQDQTEVRAVFIDETWEIHDLENCPEWASKVQHESSDIREQEPWLKKLAFSFQRKLEGKRSFPVKITREGNSEFRNVWAKSEHELKKFFPEIELQYWMPWDVNIPDTDIEIEDEFTLRYKDNDT